MKTGTKSCEKLYDNISFDTYVKDLQYVVKDTEAYGEEEYELYFAGPFFTDKQIEFCKSCKQIWEILLNNHIKTRFTNIYFPMDENNRSPMETFDNNIEQLRRCNEIIAFVSDKDVGTSVEIGYAMALEKPITLLVFDDSDFLSHTNIMLSFAGDAISIHNFADFLISNNYRKIDVQDTWEGKE